MRVPDLEACRAMLAYVPAEDRDLWIRLGMAVHSEYPGEDGFALWDAWSRSASNYREADARTVWRGFRRGGGIGIGTLIDTARRHGYAVDTRSGHAVTSSTTASGSPAAGASHEAAAREALELFERASETGASVYLERKGCRSHGLRFLADGTALVPMRDAHGRLWNVQRIAPNGEKRFLRGGRKSGLWHWIGPAVDTAAEARILIAEGYATAASVFEATGAPCAVAFDCGNLLHVARALRAAYPKAQIVLCADDDANDPDRHPDGKNPGLDKARAAAVAIGARLAVPAGLPRGLTDFNDLAREPDGPARIRAAIETAEPTAARPPASARMNGHATSAHDGAGEGEGDLFRIDEAGVWKRCYDSKRRMPYELHVCPPLHVLARARSPEGEGWGYVLEFRDPEGQTKRHVLPSRLLAGDGNEYRARLADLGFSVPIGASERRALTEFITSRAVDRFARTVKRIGWHAEQGAFVLPGRVLTRPDQTETYLLQMDGESDAGFRTRGTLREWQARVAALAVGNSRLVFAISCAFAGALLVPAMQAGGGFHLRGASSEGKTTALRVAGSVWGGPSFVQTWRATDSALEWVCASRSDTFLPLDELKEMDPTKIGACAYMIANGQGKARSNQGGPNRVRHEWRVLFLSTGEISIEDHIRAGGGKLHAGQEVRVPDIPANAGQGMGLFETLHEAASPHEFAKRINEGAHAAYGVAGPLFIEHIVARGEALSDELRARIERIGAVFTPDGAGEQVRRVAERFALVAAAGELATECGLTGWAEGVAKDAAWACFIAWVESRGSNGTCNREEIEVLRHVRTMIASNQRGRYIAWERANDSRAPNTLNALGWRRKLSALGQPIEADDFNATGDEERAVEFLHDREVFRREFANGYDLNFVLRVLKDRGHLRHDSGRLLLSVRLPGTDEREKARVVAIRSSILADGASDDVEG